MARLAELAPTSIDLVGFSRLDRPQRILVALLVVWVVAVLDFGFTLGQRRSSDFVELNPVAARIMSAPAAALATYKFGLLGLGTAILLALRQHRAAECGCWFLFTTKVCLAAHWYAYFDHVLCSGLAVG